MGFTHEHSLHRPTRRLRSGRDEFCTKSQWSRELGREVMAAGADALWTIISDK
jgi:acyl-CoA dehydrogenase